MGTIEYASSLARNLHRDQVDKSGAPYYLHVFAVRDMLTGEDEEVRIAAVLHDSVEDTDITLEELRKLGFTERTLAAIDSVTRREGETYVDLIRRACANPDSRKIKLADNLHNTMRLHNLPSEQAERMAEKYARAREILLGEMEEIA
ncbi:HD domain-containing protein [Nonomuraea sp. NPDC050691]|uniref:HD domain-containing protein n=1 Tax=Nonomuraea sp. NPDC050691 TaxID=3155661 RepID=UPI0033FE8A3E